jgi:hypothetical protein
MNKCDILNQELLTNNGFVYRKRGWYRCTEDFLQIINFQKSNWGNQYYINIGENCLSRLNAGSIIYPPERLFHLRGRVEDLGIPEETLDCMDFENSILENERKNKMTSIISECIAFLDRIRTKEGLKLEYNNSDILKSFAMYSTILSIIKQ